MATTDEEGTEDIRPSSDVELEIEVLSAGRLADAEEARTRSTRRSILLIDPDIELRAYTRRCIERSCDVGADIVEFDDAVEALYHVRQRGADLIVCDADLPRRGGFEVVEVLHADKELASVPVILLAARALPYAERRRAAKMQSVELLDEPFSARKLCGLIRRLLGDAEP